MKNSTSRPITIGSRLALIALILLGSTQSIFAQSSPPDLSGILPYVFFAVVVIMTVLFFVSRYKRCPSDKILVIYGKTGGGSAKCIHGGAAFIMPVFQDYRFLDLKPMSIDVNLQDALSKQNIRVSTPAQFTVAISHQPNLMQAAAERLLNMEPGAIRNLAHDIIMGQMRLVIANMDIEELNSDRDKFVSAVYEHVGHELHKIGLDLINVNVTDIHDESNYIKALGQEAAAKAINEAKVKVALEERTGAIGQAKASKEKRTKVAEENSLAEVGEKKAQSDAIIGMNLADVEISNSDADKRSRIAEANSLAEVGEKNAAAQATKGKNLADIEIATSNAERRQRVAESNKMAEVAEKTAQAEAEQAAYIAQAKAEAARAARELAAKRADEIVQATIAKEKAILEAEAEAARIKKVAQGEADAILSKYIAEAEGLQKVMDAQAKGFNQLVASAGGNAQAAIGMLMVDKVENIASIQADAIKNIKFDKVTVFDGGGGESTAGFVSNLFKAVPALDEFMAQSGLSLPNYLANPKQKSTPVEVESKKPRSKAMKAKDTKE